MSSPDRGSNWSFLYASRSLLVRGSVFVLSVCLLACLPVGLSVYRSVCPEQHETRSPLVTRRRQGGGRAADRPGRPGEDESLEARSSERFELVCTGPVLTVLMEAGCCSAASVVAAVAAAAAAAIAIEAAAAAAAVAASTSCWCCCACCCACCGAYCGACCCCSGVGAAGRCGSRGKSPSPSRTSRPRSAL